MGKACCQKYSKLHHHRDPVLKVQPFFQHLNCWSRSVSFDLMYLRCPIVRNFHIPNRRLNRCQEWRRCGILRKRERQFFQHLNCWSRWVIFHSSYLRCPFDQSLLSPNKRQNRCQEWRRCERLLKREPPLYDLLQGCWSR